MPGLPRGRAGARGVAGLTAALSRLRALAGAVIAGADRNGVLGRASNFSYSAFVGTVPVLFVLVSLLGLFGSSDTYDRILSDYSDQLPADVASLLDGLLGAVDTGGESALLFLVLGLVGGVWQASNVIGVVMDGLRDAHGGVGSPWVRRKARALGLAVVAPFAIVVAALAFTGGADLAEGLARLLGAGPETGAALRDAVLWIGRIVGGVGLLAMYRLAPRRASAWWGSALAGAATAGVGWLVVTTLFAAYVDGFARYNVVYGSLGAIVVYLTFLWMTGLFLLLGGEVTAAVERGPGAPAPVAGTPPPSAVAQDGAVATVMRSPGRITAAVLGTLAALVVLSLLVWAAAGPAAALAALLVVLCGGALALVALAWTRGDGEA